jgi:hypothetical protein
MTTPSSARDYAELVVDATTEQSTIAGNGSSAPSSPDRAGVWEWVTRRRALRHARKDSANGPPEVLTLQERAREIALVADRLFDAVEPVSAATGQALAADLYRQSLLWSLAARAPAGSRGADPTQLWELTGANDLLALPQQPGERQRAIEALAQADFRTFCSLGESERQRLASQLRTLAHSALDLGRPGDRLVRKLLFQRFVRSFFSVLLLSAIVAVAVVAADYVGRKPNLAAGKPWRASSSWAPCEPEVKRCGPLRAKIFFHTREDTTPWVEFDLLTATTFSEVYVRNRTDSVPDRAVPLVIEVSDDATNWRTVARRDDTFKTWTASFAPVTARYVRLRVDRRSYLHLEVVEIHA